MSKNFIELKMMVCGDEGVGKTRLIQQWAHPDHNFEDNGPTWVADVAKKEMTVNNKHYSIDIWDLPGNKRLRELLYIYQSGVHIPIFVFDASDKDGLKKLEPLIKNAKKQILGAPIFLVGNKTDLGMKISQEELSEFTQTYQVQDYLFISAAEDFFQAFETYISQAILRFEKTAMSQDLEEKISTLKTLYSNNATRNGAQSILQILEMLEQSNHQKDVQSYFNAKLPELKRHLTVLQWTWRSVLNTVVNVILTVFAALSVVGLPLLYCLDLWKPNGHENGVMNSFRFCTFGDKQKMQQLCEDVFTEKNIRGCQF